LTEHTLARLPEAAELLRVDVQELARVVSFVTASAAGRTLLWARQARAAVPAQHLADRRRRMWQEAGQAHRPVGRAPANRQDRLLRLAAETTRLSRRGRGSIAKRRPAAGAKTSTQSVAGRSTRTAFRCGQSRAHTGFDQRHDLAARLPRQPLPSRPLHNLRHSGPPREVRSSTPPSLTGGRIDQTRLTGL
jgi:hypothetical protein